MVKRGGAHQVEVLLSEWDAQIEFARLYDASQAVNMAQEWEQYVDWLVLVGHAPEAARSWECPNLLVHLAKHELSGL